MERLEPSLNPPRHFRDPFKLLAASITSRQVDFSLRSAGTSQFSIVVSTEHVFRKAIRSEEHTSELQSRLHIVCRLLLEKKNKQIRDLTASLFYPFVADQVDHSGQVPVATQPTCPVGNLVLELPG